MAKHCYFIFDLDGTVIDSSHRHATKPDGSLDLAHWIDNAKPELIERDQLLPLAKVMRRYYNEGHTIIVCTARCLQEADYDYLARYNLRYHHMLSRKGRFVARTDPEYASSYCGFVGDARGDAEMKVALLTELAHSLGYPSLKAMQPMMFDDNLAVIRTMLAQRFMCFNAIKYNERLAA